MEFLLLLLLFAFLSSPRSISKCGKISKLLVKYPLCCGQLNYEFLQYFLCGRGLFMKIRERVLGLLKNANNGGGYKVRYILEYMQEFPKNEPPSINQHTKLMMAD